MNYDLILYQTRYRGNRSTHMVEYEPPYKLVDTLAIYKGLLEAYHYAESDEDCDKAHTELCKFSKNNFFEKELAEYARNFAMDII